MLLVLMDEDYEVLSIFEATKGDKLRMFYLYPFPSNKLTA